MQNSEDNDNCSTPLRTFDVTVSGGSWEEDDVIELPRMHCRLDGRAGTSSAAQGMDVWRPEHDFGGDSGMGAEDEHHDDDTLVDYDDHDDYGNSAKTIWLHAHARSALKEAKRSTALALLAATDPEDRQCPPMSAPSIRRHDYLHDLQLIDGFDALCLTPTDIATRMDADHNISTTECGAARRYLLATQQGLSPLLRSPRSAALDSHAQLPPLLLTWHSDDHAKDEKEAALTASLTPYIGDPPIGNATLRRPREDDDGGNDHFVAAAHRTKKKLRWEGCDIPWQNRRLGHERRHPNAITTSANGETESDNEEGAQPPTKLLISELFKRHARDSAWTSSSGHKAAASGNTLHLRKRTPPSPLLPRVPRSPVTAGFPDSAFPTIGVPRTSTPARKDPPTVPSSPISSSARGQTLVAAPAATLPLTSIDAQLNNKKKRCR